MKQDLWEYLKKSNKPIALYGIGNGADKILDTLSSYGIEASGVFASDGFVKRKIFRGFYLESYEEITERLKNFIVLVAFGTFRSEVLEKIKLISKSQELYVPEVPVYGDGLFTLEYAKKNKVVLEKIYSLLCDELSKKTFENLIYYKITGNPQFLYDCEVDANEPYNSFLKLNDCETFLDLGAYNGDTVKDFINRTNGKYNKIYAVEPDIKSYKKLIENTKEYKNIEHINACVSNEDGTKFFSMKGGRNSSLGIGTQVSCKKIDSIAKNDATFIKFDVEGEEINAIEGATKTILKHKSKLQIASYHRTEDIFAIPEKVLSIRNDYKIYIRHNPYLPAWDTNYFFI